MLKRSLVRVSSETSLLLKRLLVWVLSEISLLVRRPLVREDEHRESSLQDLELQIGRKQTESCRRGKVIMENAMGMDTISKYRI